MQKQFEDMVVSRNRKDLQEAGNAGALGSEYVMDDNGLLWVARWERSHDLQFPNLSFPGFWRWRKVPMGIQGRRELQP